MAWPRRPRNHNAPDAPPGQRTHKPAITPSDALVVIDMQRDFVPKSVSNTDGGRFGVPEGDHIVPACEQLIQHFVQQGAYVVHSHGHGGAPKKCMVPTRAEAERIRQEWLAAEHCTTYTGSSKASCSQR